jgi:HD-GYP domain-containing protein (c-di-GMP phosphodiesterase class II)
MLADTLDAMTSDRPYRKAATFAQAREEIARCAGTQFDPRCVEAFLAVPEEQLVLLRQG